jgi:hypothetical protein
VALNQLLPRPVEGKPVEPPRKTQRYRFIIGAARIITPQHAGRPKLLLGLGSRRNKGDGRSREGVKINGDCV